MLFLALKAFSHMRLDSGGIKCYSGQIFTFVANEEGGIIRLFLKLG